MLELAPSPRAVSAILDDALAGRRISAGDAHRLLLDGDLLTLGMAAHEVRNRHNDAALRLLQRRPQHQLHQRLRLQVPVLRLLPAARARRGLPGLLRGDRPQGRGDAGAQRHRHPAPGRGQPGPAALLLRRPAPLPARHLPGDPPPLLLAARDQVHREEGADVVPRRPRRAQGGRPDVDPGRRRRDPLRPDPQGGPAPTRRPRRRSGSTSCARPTATACARRRP